MTKKGLIGFTMALFLVLGFATAFAGQIDGMRSNNGPTLPGTNSATVVSDFFNTIGATSQGLSDALDVYVNPGGLGDTLIYNYFNARDGYATWFTVVNTDSVYGHRVRLRFREAEDVAGVSCPNSSLELLDFDICLSVNDMFSAWVEKNPVTGGARICSGDNDTLIFEGTDGSKSLAEWGCVDFKFGDRNIVPEITASNTLEGYFEIIGENRLAAEPSTCEWTSTLDAERLKGDVGNVLFGNALLIDAGTPAYTAIYGYNATALADFVNSGITYSTAVENPTLADSGDGLDGVQYALTKNMLFGTYLVGADLDTEYVVTLPTKRLDQIARTCANSIFADDRVTFTAWTDDEQSEISRCSFSPCPQGSDRVMPFEVNVIPMGISGGVTSEILTSEVMNDTFNTALQYGIGWVQMDLNKASTPYTDLHEISATDGVTTWITRGWPSLGLQLFDYKSWNAATPMQYTSDITADTIN
ncbi:MAG: hypothetical protein C0402_06365 [Thermodesulfovibrio sp.]|nr:hypothetical protein [Thermodesulfovibrio sp.]